MYTSMYVCTLSAHLTQSTFLCVALVVAVAVVGHQALLLLLLWFILCLISSALCYRCVWVIMYMHICVCNHFFVHISWLPCLSLKKPISFRMCISFIWKRWKKKLQIIYKKNLRVHWFTQCYNCNGRIYNFLCVFFLFCSSEFCFCVSWFTYSCVLSRYCSDLRDCNVSHC